MGDSKWSCASMRTCFWRHQTGFCWILEEIRSQTALKKIKCEENTHRTAGNTEGEGREEVTVEL